MTKETQFVEEMIELFSDTPYANTKDTDNEFSLSGEALSTFFRQQHNQLRTGMLDHLFEQVGHHELDLELLKQYPMNEAGYKQAESQPPKQEQVAGVSIEILKKAVENIKEWHNFPAMVGRRSEKEIEHTWQIYYNNAPEMKAIREALSESQQPKKEQ